MSGEWMVCEDCEDGLVGHDCGEDTCCCLNPVPNVLCKVCNGEGIYKAERAREALAEDKEV